MNNHSASTPHDIQPSSKRVILVVDDERAFCDVLCEILEAMGYDSHYALTALEALDMLPLVKPELLLTDIMMPEMDGITFISQVRAQPNWENMPIVVVSAKATPDDRQSALDSGATEFLAKPFSSFDLEAIIETLLPPN